MNIGKMSLSSTVADRAWGKGRGMYIELIDDIANIITAHISKRLDDNVGLV